MNSPFSSPSVFRLVSMKSTTAETCIKYNKTSICISTRRGRGSMLNRHPVRKLLYPKHFNRFIDIARSAHLSKETLVQGFEKPTPSSVSPLDLYGRAVTHNARLVKGARTKVDERICRLFNAWHEFRISTSSLPLTTMISSGPQQQFCIQLVQRRACWKKIYFSE